MGELACAESESAKSHGLLLVIRGKCSVKKLVNAYLNLFKQELADPGDQHAIGFRLYRDWLDPAFLEKVYVPDARF